MKEEYFSAKFEPAHGSGRFEPDPAEISAAAPDAREDKISETRDSVFNEPAIGSGAQRPYLAEWIERKRAECSVAGNLGVAFLAAILGGPFALVGAFMAGSQGWYGWIYIIVFAPVIEEFLKQSGMIYLVEKKPYRVFAAWQFVFSAVVAALVFATIENLLYINVYAARQHLTNAEVLGYFRWTVCTMVHVGCSAIASLGMIRVWKKQLADGRAADLSAAYTYFVIAIVVHGLYNLLAIFLSRFFFE